MGNGGPGKRGRQPVRGALCLCAGGLSSRPSAAAWLRQACRSSVGLRIRLTSKLTPPAAVGDDRPVARDQLLVHAQVAALRSPRLELMPVLVEDQTIGRPQRQIEEPVQPGRAHQALVKAHAQGSGSASQASQPELLTSQSGQGRTSVLKIPSVGFCNSRMRGFESRHRLQTTPDHGGQRQATPGTVRQHHLRGCSYCASTGRSHPGQGTSLACAQGSLASPGHSVVLQASERWACRCPGPSTAHPHPTTVLGQRIRRSRHGPDPPHAVDARDLAGGRASDSCRIRARTWSPVLRPALLRSLRHRGPWRRTQPRTATAPGRRRGRACGGRTR